VIVRGDWECEQPESVFSLVDAEGAPECDAELEIRSDDGAIRRNLDPNADCSYSGAFAPGQYSMSARGQSQAFSIAVAIAGNCDVAEAADVVWQL
jgi:hypothetical protein